MIHEISQFIDYLERNSPDVFSENLELKEGLYVFLEKEDNKLVIKDENVLRVDKNTKKNILYNAFLERVVNTEMINAMKSFNAGPKVYIAIGTPFGISFSGKGYKLGKEKMLFAAKAYFKAASRYIENDNQKYLAWFDEFQLFVKNKMFEYIESKEEYQKVKDNYMFYFFLKEPILGDFIKIYNKYLSERIFNDNSYNIPRTKKNGIPDGNTFGIPDCLSGFNSKKPFLEHKTSPSEVNHRVNLKTAFNLKKFFDLQQKNKILPNPMPVFVDEAELTSKAIKFYKEDTKKGHKEIIEDLLNIKENLQNYYIIYFQNGLKGSKIVDIDFVPVFRYKTDDMPEIENLFKVKEKGQLKHYYPIKNIFEFERLINDRIFLQYPGNSDFGYGILVGNYFSPEIKPYKGYTITETTLNLLYKYRKAFYDYIYKSKKQAITGKIFYDIMSNSILDDIRHDKDHNKTFIIKEKLNILFSLFNYFIYNENSENMASKIPELIERCKKIANNDNEHLSDDPKEFAFAAGQLIYFLLDKSEASNKTHALLEPFLQKTQAIHLQNAIGNTISIYKHAINFGKGRFERIAKEVLAYETDVNIKDLQRFVLAGYFAEPVIYEKIKKDE